MQIILYHLHSDINGLGHYAVITCINALLGKVITVLIVMWFLTTVQVINVECGIIYVDEMVVWQRMHQLQWCVIHAMLLAILPNAWRLTRPIEEDKTPPCVTPCYSVLTVESSCIITKKGLGVEQTYLW